MRKLHRSRRVRVLGGVAAGFAEYFSIDVTLMRLLFALLAITVPNTILAYILAWIIIPEEPLEGTSSTREIVITRVGDTQVDERKDLGNLPPTAEELLGNRPDGTGPVRVDAPKKLEVPHDRSRQLFGYVLIAVGAIVLSKRFLPGFLWRLPSNLIGQFWPVLLILAGVALIFGAIRGR